LNRDNKELFKDLIEILFILHMLAIGVLLILVPFLAISGALNSSDLDGFSIFEGIAVVILMACLFLFMRGLFYLRKVAKSILAEKYFSLPMIDNLGKSGRDFLKTGFFSFGIILVLWLGDVSDGKLVFGLDINMMSSLFLMIVGLFFIIQSNTLAYAKDIKEENDLTV
jgi:hypothetical protein